MIGLLGLQGLWRWYRACGFTGHCTELVGLTGLRTSNSVLKAVVGFFRLYGPYRGYGCFGFGFEVFGL